MIHHLSLPAKHSKHVSKVLAELLDGQITGFGPYPDSYIVWMGDAHGSAIEVYPQGTELSPDPAYGQAQFKHNPNTSGLIATHAALSIGCDEQKVFHIAQREGWRAMTLPRGHFRVIEFWIENQVMLELMTPEMTADYIAATRAFLTLTMLF